MTAARIAELTRLIAEIDAGLNRDCTPEHRYALKGERRELNSERSALETARFLQPWVELRAA
jgi:hypothetical protein